MINYNILKELSDKKQLIFLLILCKRSFNNYLEFSKNEMFGNPDVLLEIENIATRYILFNELDVELLNSYKTKLSNISPHMDDFSSAQATYALDACSLYYDVLSFLQKNEDKNVILSRASKLSVNTVYVSVEDYFGGDVEETVIIDSKQMKNEIRFQNEIIEILLHIKVEDELFKLLKKDFGNNL